MQQQQKYKYPQTRRDEIYRDSHSLKDPYVWLEDPEAEETKQWVDQQNLLTENYLNECNYRAKINDKLTEIYNYEKISCPYKKGPYYFFEKNDGLQNQYVIYMQKSLNEEATVFLDPNTFSEDGTAALNTKKFSDSGKYFAYGVSKSGSDWEIVYIRDVEKKQELPESLEYVKFTNFSWTKDELGFFYGRYPKPEKSDELGKEVEQNLNYKIYYHQLGTQQSSDILIFEMPEMPELMFDAQVTNDGQILLMKIQEGCAEEHKLYYCYLTEFIKSKNSKLEFVKLVDNFESKYEYIGNFGTKFYFVNNLKAPRNQVIAFDLKSPSQWEYVIKESQKDVIVAVSQVNHNCMLVNLSHNVCDVLQLYDFNGKFIKDIPLPPLPAIYYSCEYDQSEFFYKYVSFLSPGTIYHYSFETQQLKIFKEIKIKGFDPSHYDAQQIFYESRDFTKIPMFIISKKGLQKDGQRPFQLYGYGGFNISETPYFSAIKIVLLNNLGVNLAIANIRGGSEYGEDWHQQGMKENKQNVFEDFQAAAEYLVKEKYTNSSKICIYGGSNGGLLVAACANQRPDLFGCAIADCGVLDMLKFHKFTIGHAWTTDYGCADNAEDFAYLIKYSPVHNVKKQKYPPVLLNTADHDDRVVPLHSYKYISELQYKVGNEQFQTDPLLIRIEVKAGHGAGKPTTKIIEEYRDIYAFIMNSLKLSWIE